MDKNVLKKFAIESRQELMEKVANKINRYFVDEEFNVNQNGEVYVLINDKHTLRLAKSEYENRQLLVKRIKEITLEQVIEEAAYTWFNRIIAIRYMEIHDYLPLTEDNQSLGVRVLSSKDNTPDPEIMKISNLLNPDLDIEFNKEYYGTIQDNNKRFEYILLLVCKKLGKVIPQVFDGITDYIDILTPENMLNDSGYITKLLKDVDITNFEEVEIIGWLYQYWNTEEFNRIYDGDMSNIKISAQDLPAATQLFTPDWVVRYMVENTLGRYWIEHGGKKELIKNWKYYIEIDNLEIKNNLGPTEIKCIDPCSGSGHVLIYMFEVLYQIYLSYGYSKKDIVELIIKNNIYGLEIDDRAGQLSILSVLLKAREYEKDIFNKEVIKELNVLSIQESNSINRNVACDILNDEAGYYLIDTFQNAKEIGSLLTVEKKDYDKIKENLNEITIYNNEIKEKVLKLIKTAEIMAQKYDIVVTNPPYMNRSKMSGVLSSFCLNNYSCSIADLATVFVDKIMNEYTVDEGYNGFVTTISWMYLKTFENFRSNLMSNKQIVSLVDFGTELFEGKIGHLPIVSWTQKNILPKDDLYAIRLSEFCYSKRAEKQIEFYNKKNHFTNNQIKLKSIPGCPLAYWINPRINEIFKRNDSLFKESDIKKGLSTCDNDRFIRFWYEVALYKIGLKLSQYQKPFKWIPVNKGGDYRKWYGNNNWVINWENDGLELKNFKKSVIRNESYYFRKSITWTMISATSLSARASEQGKIFEGGGPSLFTDDKNYNYILALLLTKLGGFFIKIINPTLNININDIGNIPFVYDENYKDEINKLVRKCIELSKEDWDSFEVSWDFIKHPLIEYKSGSGFDKDINKWNYKIKDSFESWKSNCDEKFKLLKQNEEELNRIFIEIYGLKNELTFNVEDKDITIRKADREREIKSLISYAVGCMFGRYSLDENGLVYAGGEFDKNKYKTFEIDMDNIIPITEDNYFGDDIVSRFKKFIEIVYGKETLYENLEYIAEILGKKNGENSEETIRRYFINDFYNDHLKIYQKRPIYWLFDSGKKSGFKCLIYMHRYNEGIVSKIRLDYLHRIQNTYERELKEISDKLNGDLDLTTKRELSKKQVDLSAKLQETNEYDEKIAHIADQKIKIDLDDGVAVNYAKFSVKNPKTGKEESILAKIK